MSNSKIPWIKPVILDPHEEDVVFAQKMLNANKFLNAAYVQFDPAMMGSDDTAAVKVEYIDGKMSYTPISMKEYYKEWKQ